MIAGNDKKELWEKRVESHFLHARTSEPGFPKKLGPGKNICHHQPGPHSGPNFFSSDDQRSAGNEPFFWLKLSGYIDIVTNTTS